MAEVRKIRPAIRVLFMSGYTEDEVLRSDIEGRGAAFLEKPFTPGELTRQVRGLIDSPGSFA